MANFVYGKAKQGILNGQFNFSSDTFKVAFVKNTYTPSQSSDEFISDIGNAKISFRTDNIPGITNTLGVIDGTDMTFYLPANTAFNAVVFYKVGANDSSSRLLFYIDTAEGMPFPGSPDAVVIVINWNNEISKILSL